MRRVSTALMFFSLTLSFVLMLCWVRSRFTSDTISYFSAAQRDGHFAVSDIDFGWGPAASGAVFVIQHDFIHLRNFAPGFYWGYQSDVPGELLFPNGPFVPPQMGPYEPPTAFQRICFRLGLYWGRSADMFSCAALRCRSPLL